MTVKEILSRWEDFEISEDRRDMQIGLDYFNCKNEITKPNAGRYAHGLDEKNFEYKTKTLLSDRRIANNFFKFIINQQVAYGIARNFILTTSAIEEKEDTLSIFSKLKSKILGLPTSKRNYKDRFEEFNILVSKTFQKNYADFVDACTNAPMQKIGWIYIYYNDKMQLEFMSMNPMELCPVWDNTYKPVLKEMIRKYKVKEYTDEGMQENTYIEHYALDHIDRYKYSNETTEEPNLIESVPYFYSSNGRWEHFNSLPFIPIRYNAKNNSLLTDIKTQVDAYDKVLSEIANNIIDIPNSEIFITGIDGGNPEEVETFVKNVKRTRYHFAPEGSDAKSLAMPQNIEDQISLLTSLRKIIFELGGGVDTQNKDLKDTSGVALRWSYSNLEEKFNIWANQINDSIGKIIEFILEDNVRQGGEDYSDIDYNIVYDTDSIINESETIQNLQLSKGLISAETIAANHPYTKDATKEFNGMREQMEFENALNLKDTNQQTNEKIINSTITE